MQMTSRYRKDEAREWLTKELSLGYITVSKGGGFQDGGGDGR